MGGLGSGGHNALSAHQRALRGGERPDRHSAVPLGPAALARYAEIEEIYRHHVGYRRELVQALAGFNSCADTSRLARAIRHETALILTLAGQLARLERELPPEEREDPFEEFDR